MTGPRDYWLRVVVPDLAAYERFLKTKLTRLEGIASIESSFALEQVKYTNVLPVAVNGHAHGGASRAQFRARQPNYYMGLAKRLGDGKPQP